MIIDPNSMTLTDDYENLLKSLGVSYESKPPYYLVGNPQQRIGWVIHLSIAIENADQLLPEIVRILIDKGATFMMAQNKNSIIELIEGSYGTDTSRKIISIYASDDQEAAYWEILLVKATAGYNIRGIPAAAHLGNAVFASYHGEPTQGGIKWPFVAKQPHQGLQTKQLYNNKYVVTKTLQTNSKGNVYMAYYFKGLFRFQRCVIKEARPEAQLNGWQDMEQRLEWQWQVQTVLKGKVAIPEIVDRFTTDGHHYLVMEYIKGLTVWQFIEKTYQKSTFDSLTGKGKRRVCTLAIKIIDFLANLHAHGFVHRDINFTNFIVNKKKKVIGIDTEMFYDFQNDVPNPPFYGGTPGFISPQQQALLEPSVEDDIFGLGALLLYLFGFYVPSESIDKARSRQNQNTVSNENLEVLSTVLQKCLEEQRSQRPSLQQIRQFIAGYQSQIK